MDRFYCCTFFPGAGGIVQADLIATLVNKLKSDLDEIKVFYAFGNKEQK